MAECNKRRSTDNDETCPLAGDAADQAVRKVFAILGVDIDKPESVEAFREDLRFGKRLRKAADHGTMVLTGAVIMGLCWAAWSGIIDQIRRH